jgi:hypothetical protein
MKNAHQASAKTGTKSANTQPGKTRKTAPVNSPNGGWQELPQIQIGWRVIAQWRKMAEENGITFSDYIKKLLVFGETANAEWEREKRVMKQRQIEERQQNIAFYGLPSQPRISFN